MHVSWQEVYQRMESAPPGRLYGVPRGGAIVAGLSGRAVDKVEVADWIVRDVVADADAGGSPDAYQGKPVWGLFDRTRDGVCPDRLVLPWDSSPGRSASERLDRLEAIGRDLLETLGYDPSRDGLQETPNRWARWWEEFHSVHKNRIDTTFEVATSGQLVAVSGIRVWSMCEHHLLPFVAEVTIGYIPGTRLLGLSKFARIADNAARRLQVQERMTDEIADEIGRATGTMSVAVLARGRHLCMEVRGVRTPASTSTLALRGAFRVDSALRLDLYHLAGMSAPAARQAHDMLNVANG
jgi:GTP cyclohydrolase I